MSGISRKSGTQISQGGTPSLASQIRRCIHYESEHSSPHPTLQFAVCSVISSSKLLFPWQRVRARRRQNTDREKIKSEWGKYRPGGHFGHIHKTVMRHSQLTWQILSATPLRTEWRAVGLKLQTEKRWGERKKTTFKTDEINMVLQRDQVTVWERHIKHTTLTRLNVSALIWREGGLWRGSGCRWSGPYFSWTPSKSVSLEELVGHRTLSRHPERQGNVQHRAFRWARLGLVLRVESQHIWFYDQMLNISLGWFFFLYIITCQSFGRLFWYLISRDNLLISTSDCKCLFFFMIFCESLQNACCVWSIKLISDVYLCLLQWAHVDHEYLLHFPQVPVNPFFFCSAPDSLFPTRPFRLMTKHTSSLLLAVFTLNSLDHKVVLTKWPFFFFSAHPSALRFTGGRIVRAKS